MFCQIYAFPREAIDKSRAGCYNNTVFFAITCAIKSDTPLKDYLMENSESLWRADCVSLFRHLNDTLTASRELMYEKAKNGNLDVPKRYVTENGLTLGEWLATQRKKAASGKRSGREAGGYRNDPVVFESEVCFGRIAQMTAVYNKDGHTFSCIFIRNLPRRAAL